MKKLSLILVLVAMVNTVGLFAQEEEATTGLLVSGEVWTRGWVGAQHYGADLKGGDTFLKFEYKFTNYSGLVFAVNADGAVLMDMDTTSGESWYSLRTNLGDVYGYTDVLREFGIKTVGLRVQAGKFSVGNNHYNPGSFGAGDDSITASDNYNTDLLNLLLEFNIDRDIVPLVIRLGGDLDFGFYNGKTPTGLGFLNNGGYHFLAEIDLDHMEIAKAVDLGVSVYTTISNPDVNFSNGTFYDGKPQLNIGATVGVGILNLPVNLKIGGSINYFDLYNDHNQYGYSNPVTGEFTKAKGAAAQFAVEVGKDEMIDASIGYKFDPLNKAGHFVGLKAQLTMFNAVQPYAGFGFRVDMPGYSKFADYNAAEVGVKIVPTDGVSLYIGWIRQGNGAFLDPDPSSPTAGEYYIHSGGDINGGMAAQAGWGGVYLKAGFVF